MSKQYKNVYCKKNKKTCSYESSIHTKNNKFYLGSYKTAEQAAFAYDVAAKTLLKDLAYLNFNKSIPLDNLQQMVIIEKVHKKLKDSDLL